MKKIYNWDLMSRRNILINNRNPFKLSASIVKKGFGFKISLKYFLTSKNDIRMIYIRDLETTERGPNPARDR